MSNYNDIFSVNDTDENGKQIVIPNRTGKYLQAKQKSGSISDFAYFALPRNYNIARSFGLPKQLALLRARDMTIQQGLESQYGRSNAAVNNHNRSGMMSNGKPIYYSSPDLNDIAIVKSFQHNPNWMKALYAPTTKDYFYQLQNTKNGGRAYEATMSDKEYYNRAIGTKTLQNELDKIIKSGATNSWTMNPTRYTLDSTIGMA